MQRKTYIFIVAILVVVSLATCSIGFISNAPTVNEPDVEYPPQMAIQLPDEPDYIEDYSADEYHEHITEYELYEDDYDYIPYVEEVDQHFELLSIEGTADSMTGDRWDRMLTWRENAVLLAERHRDSVIINMNPNENVIYLTFDDGPDPTNTVRVINTLIEHDVSATFFFLGENMRRHPEVVQMAYDAGFTIGLHGYTHSSFTQLSEEAIIAELEAANDVLESITGSRATTMRPPYGAIGDDEVEIISAQNLIIYLWSLDTLDWAQTNANEILRNVETYLRPGEIVLMHAFSGQRLVPEILPEMIEFILNEGFEIRALPR